MLDMPKARDAELREADSCDQSAADRLVATLKVVKEAIANPSARA
jgi:hypothetical protein